MKNNQQILKEHRTKIESAEGINLNYAMLDAMKEAQREILNEVLERFDSNYLHMNLPDIINELKEELK